MPDGPPRIDDTRMGGPDRAFPSTIWDLVDRARNQGHPESREALNEIVRLYWKPVYVRIRRSWTKAPEDAKDLTQGFFLEIVEKNWLGQVDRGRFRLRACLKAALDHFLIDDDRCARAKKRGGEAKVLPLDFAALDGEAGPAAGDSDDVFDRAWVATLMEQSLEELHRRWTAAGREPHYEALKGILEPPGGGEAASYDEIARRLSVSVAAVTNYIHRARVELRGIIVDRIRRQVSSAGELEQEIRELFGTGHE